MKCGLIFLVCFLVLLSGCGKECSSASDCLPRHAFVADCVDGLCVYSPIPNMVGNGICEAGENECTAPQDCGQCAGKVPGSKYLVQSCVQQECVPEVMPSLLRPEYLAKEVRSGVETFQVELAYDSPFNMRKDVLRTKVSLTKGEDVKILSAELKAATPDKHTVILANQQVNKPVYPGYPVTEDLVLDFPTADFEGTLKNLMLTVYYRSGSDRTFTARFGDFIFVRPDAAYPCPFSCDDQNPGTRDYCGSQTDYFCMHDPIPGTCGNFVCDSDENKCACPRDCGPCEGIGEYVEFACKANQCVGVLKPGLRQQPVSLFDERRVGPFELTNTFSFNNPFIVKEDKFSFEFSTHPDSGFKIETVRLLEKDQKVAELVLDRQVQGSFAVDVDIDPLPSPEEDHTLSLGVWYSYMQNEQEKRGHFTKSLGKITFLSVE